MVCHIIYPSKHGLFVHKERWCKGRKRHKKPSRKVTVADRVVQRHKVDEFQKTLDQVKLDGIDLDSVYSFIYLGAEIAGDGDHSITLKHRCNIAIVVLENTVQY